MPVGVSPYCPVIRITYALIFTEFNQIKTKMNLLRVFPLLVFLAAVKCLLLLQKYRNGWGRASKAEDKPVGLILDRGGKQLPVSIPCACTMDLV